MDKEQFHSVDSESLKKIRINDILRGQNIAPERIDYSVPVYTSNKSLTAYNQETWLLITTGGGAAASGYICGHSGHCH